MNFRTGITTRWNPRLFGPGERIVFEPYSNQIYADTQKWIMERGIFPEGDPVVRKYDESVVTAV